MVQVLFPSKLHLTRVKSEKNDGKLRGTARNLLVVHVMFFAHQNPLRFCTFPRESLGERLLDPWSLRPGCLACVSRHCLVKK